MNTKTIKKIIAIAFICIFTLQAQAQLFKKLEDKIKKVANKEAPANKQQTGIEKKEITASSEYSDVTENNENPIFVDAVPANGKMILKLSKGDRFWGGHIILTGQPKKEDANAKVLEYLNARVGSFYTAGEMSNYAIYFDGQRLLNDASIIPLRPGFISYEVNKTPFFSSAEAKTDMSTMPPKVTQPTFTFKYDGKTYGPFDGIPEGMLVLKSMKDGKPTEKFYGLGSESFITDKDAGYHGLIQTEKGITRIKDYALRTLSPTHPGGSMVMAQGKKVYTFSNGKTVPVVKIPGISGTNMYESGPYFSEVYGTDSSHVVCIVNDRKDTAPYEVYIDFKTALHFPEPITKKNLLISKDPAKSVLYKAHTLYYANGTKEIINNTGDAQLIGFNGKEYIVWFEVMKAEDGHEIYVCQKELK